MERKVRRKIGRRTAVITAAAISLALWRCTYNGFTLAEWQRDLHSGVVFSRGDTNARVVALTFDDGPDPRYTERVLNTLHQFNVHGTFFQQGRLVDRYPQITRLTLASGNCIGNHTYSHPFLERLSRSAIRHEIEAGAASLTRAADITTALFRPPRGDWNPTIYSEAVRAHVHIILWSVALEHHEVKTPRAMANRVLRLVRPGDIILMHDGAFISRENTVEAVPLLIAGLQKMGYRCITVPELLNIPGDTQIASGTPASASRSR